MCYFNIYLFDMVSTVAHKQKLSIIILLSNESVIGLFHCHRIDTRPEVSLLCVLAWEKRPKFYDAILECTRHFVPMFVPMKNFRVHSRMASYMAYLARTKYRLSRTSGLVSILCHYLFIVLNQIHIGHKFKISVSVFLLPILLVFVL
jgi:hypothetical protein